MGKVPIRLREVVYTLSPFEQTVMNGVFKDVPEKLHRKFSEAGLCRTISGAMVSFCMQAGEQKMFMLQNWVDVGVFFIAPVAATFA